MATIAEASRKSITARPKARPSDPYRHFRLHSDQAHRHAFAAWPRARQGFTGGGGGPTHFRARVGRLLSCCRRCLPPRGARRACSPLRLEYTAASKTPICIFKLMPFAYAGSSVPHGAIMLSKTSSHDAGFQPALLSTTSPAMTYDAIILGAGGAGLLAAATAGQGRRPRPRHRSRGRGGQEDPDLRRRALQFHQYGHRAPMLSLGKPAFREVGAEALHPVGLPRPGRGAMASPGTKRPSASCSATARPGRSSTCCWRNARRAASRSGFQRRSAISAMPTGPVHSRQGQRAEPRHRHRRPVDPEDGRHRPRL